jgi:cytochrome c oxidase assembly factor CtaG
VPALTLALALGATAFLYARGLVAMPCRPSRAGRAAAYAAGLRLLLLALGSPSVALVWGLPRPARRARRWAPWRLWRALARPPVAWVLHALALWSWHLPAAFEAALASPLLHVAEHATLLGTALLLWWSAFGRRSAYGVGVLCVFTTALHSGVLGALTTFSPAPWYPTYAAAAIPGGLSPLEDQQLAGLLMWVAAGALYLLTALVLFGLWLGRPPRGLDGCNPRFCERRRLTRSRSSVPAGQRARSTSLPRAELGS